MVSLHRGRFVVVHLTFKFSYGPPKFYPRGKFLPMSCPAAATAFLNTISETVGCHFGNGCLFEYIRPLLGANFHPTEPLNPVISVHFIIIVIMSLLT